MKSKEKKIVIILIVSLILLDQILKIVFLTTQAKIGNLDSWSIGILEQTKTENNIQYILVLIIAIMALIRYITSNNSYIKMNSRVILCFAIAGAVSILIDRIWKHGTINYINIPKFASINLGYIYFLVTWIGMAIILTKYTTERIKERRNGD